MATPVVTALRARGRRGVEVELDGVAWRVIPVSSAAEAALGVGTQLDRDRARALGRALRRERALGVAVRAFGTPALASLARAPARGAGRAGGRPRRSARVLARAGLVDDERSASAARRSLAERGRGRPLIRDDLERQGFRRRRRRRRRSPALEPESTRAGRIVEARGRSARTARHLAAKGFSEEIARATRLRSWRRRRARMTRLSSDISPARAYSRNRPDP